jgi:hypothetical protein
VRDELARNRRFLELDAEHEPFAANLLEQVIVVGNQLLERGAQPLAHSRDVLEEARLEHHVENGHPGCHRQRVAAVVEPCVPNTMPLAASSVARQAPSGKPRRCPWLPS